MGLEPTMGLMSSRAACRMVTVQLEATNYLSTPHYGKGGRNRTYDRLLMVVGTGNAPANDQLMGLVCDFRISPLCPPYYSDHLATI